MQNRSMFPYRRQGPKKRNKNGPNRTRPRGPQKPLPNSARELLPLLQPATKALAQVLAGRASASGQFGHAQAVAAQAERLIAERAHNRLNPAEREEFFEQLARLKLTVTDAEAEAEVQAEDDVAKPAPRPPVAQERLMQMALALTAPDASRGGAGNGEAAGEDDDGPAEPEKAEAQVPDAQPAEARERQAETESRGEARSVGNVQSGRLQLSRPAAERAAGVVAAGRVPRSAPARRVRPRAGAGEETPAEPGEEIGEPAPTRLAPPTGQGEPGEAHSRPGGEGGPESADEVISGNGTATARRPRRAKQKGLPEGWVIDEEGFVVPGR